MWKNWVRSLNRSTDKDGNNISLDDFFVDQEQFKKINEHKTQGKVGKFKLTYSHGKDKNLDNMRILVDETQLAVINRAKKNGKTGVFGFTFSLSDGKKATVKVTLTGDHREAFGPDGGDCQPETEETVPEWEYKKRARRGRVSRTGDERQILCLILVFGTALTGFAAGLGKKKK